MAKEGGDKRDIKFEGEKMKWIRLVGEGERERIIAAEGEQKEESKLVRRLEVWMDRERKFHKRVEIEIAGEKRVAGATVRQRKGTKGIGVGNTLKLYMGCGRAILDYGSRVW